MKIFTVIVASLVLLSGIVYSQVHSKFVDQQESKRVLSADAQGELLSEKEEEKDVADKNVSPFIQENIDTPTPTPTPTPTQTSDTKRQTDYFLESFVYPASEIIKFGSDSLLLRSADNTDKITDWYKEKILSIGMNVKSFVTTKANEKILNKLAGTKEGLEISVEIKKESSSFVEISINFNGD